MGWLNRFAARQIVRTQRLILKRIELADAAIALCERYDRWGEKVEWKGKRARHVREFHRLQGRLDERLAREKGPAPAAG